MTATKKREPTLLEPLGEVHPLLKKPIPHAYALVPHPERPGLYYAVHLEGVTAERLEHLEVNGREQHPPIGMARIELAMQRRHFERKWG